MNITLTLATPSQADARTASKMVTDYYDSQRGSNRGQLAVIVAVMSAVLCARRTGNAVEVTDAFEHVFGGKSPAYNLLHARIGTGAIRSNAGFWESVQAVALVNVTAKGRTVTGTPHTRATFSDGARVFVCPAE